MRLLIDGYNLMFQSIVSKNGLEGKNALRQARGRLMQMVVDLIEDSIRTQTMIVFDAKEAPSGVADRYQQYGIQIVFARDWDSADEMIQNEIRRHSAPKNLMVVSSDHAIQRKAKARGAQVMDCEEWIDQQIDLKAQRHKEAESSIITEEKLIADIKQRPLSDSEKQKWLDEFGC